MYVFICSFILSFLLCLWSGYILGDENEPIFAKIAIPAITAFMAYFCVTWVVEDYKVIEKNGTVPDTTITIKNEVADTVTKYIINYEGK